MKSTCEHAKIGLIRKINKLFSFYNEKMIVHVIVSRKRKQMQYKIGACYAKQYADDFYDDDEAMKLPKDMRTQLPKKPGYIS